MDYEWCRVKQLVRHAQYGDPQATSLLINEIRDYLRYFVERFGDPGTATSDFAQQLLAVTRRDYGEFWSDDAEFSVWIDGILRREVEEACQFRGVAGDDPNRVVGQGPSS
jgi:hypothetical protein